MHSVTKINKYFQGFQNSLAAGKSLADVAEFAAYKTWFVECLLLIPFWSLMMSQIKLFYSNPVCNEPSFLENNRLFSISIIKVNLV